MEAVSTWIKLHRKITEWGWYGDPNTKAVFLHLLLTANIKETEYRGVKILPGQTIIGRKALAETLGMSERNVRTALNHLKSTNEVTIETTNRFSVVTVVNWASYQLTDAEVTNKVTNELTNNRPASDQQVTTPKEYKNKRNKEYIYSDVPESIKDSFMEWVAMRKRRNRPIESKSAVTRALNKLQSLSKNPERQKELIEYAIYKNWLSFYPIPQEDIIPKPKVVEEEKPIDSVPMPEDTRNKIAALGFGNIIGKEK